jgi:taurine dioxygenase
MATNVKAADTISVTKLHPLIGAELRGVDLSRELDAETIEIVLQAWHDNSVLVFRDQDMSGEDQLRFAGYFGPIAERHVPKDGSKGAVNGSPEWNKLMPVSDKKDEDGNAAGALGHGELWFHSDKCYHEKPHRATFLYGIEIPRDGGNTKFACLYGAYENLPDKLRARLPGHRIMQGYDYDNTARLGADVDLDKIFHFSQPIFVTNPGSGRKALYVSRLNTMWIEGIERAESDDMLAQMFEITEKPENVYEHVWQPGDLVMWDNLACLHARTDWPDEQTRLLRRCTVRGEKLD